MSSPNRMRRWASHTETAEYLGISKRTVRLMVSDGRLRQYTLGGHIIRIDLDEVDRALLESASEAAQC